ncbi:hypothetical protein FB451DRAFT_1191895 [Mycena latifolia]|nr:hypothetical protein FB451DRAFT_1191895 [Mycena latifolia]
MNINDPEYAPIYYKVMVMDQSGTAEKCVKPPFGDRTEARTRGPLNMPQALKTEGQSPATYPNNIPLGQPQRYGPGTDFKGCYGCLEDGHRIFECRQIDREKTVHSFYQAEARRPHVVELTSGSSADEESENQGGGSESELSEDSEEEYEGVYLTVPRKKGRKSIPIVQQVDQTVPSMHTVQQQAFDGVYPPSRERGKPRGGEKEPEKTQMEQMSKPNEVTSPVVDQVLPPHSVEGDKVPLKSKPSKAGPLSDVVLIEARRVRFNAPEDAEMVEAVLEHESCLQLVDASVQVLNSITAWIDFFGERLLENVDKQAYKKAADKRRILGDSGSRRSQPTDYGPPLFFSRMRHHHPYEPHLTKPSDDPIAIVEAAVNRFWENSESEEGVACEPTFSAAPLSEYYGAVTLPGGQRLHYSLGLNALKVLMNPETERPFCVVGHEISIFVESPTDPEEPWEFEIPFPPPRILRSAMLVIMPHDPPREGETGFPMHTTEYAPPMMTATERLEARLRCRGTVRPSDLSSGDSDSSSDRSPPSSGTASSFTVDSGSNGTTLVNALAEDILKRVKKDVALQLTNELGKPLNPIDDRIPELSLADLTDEEEESAPIKTGICPVCFELEHFPVDCPTPATTDHGEFAKNITTDHGELLVTRPELSEAPTLNALLTLPPLDAARYIHLMDAAWQVREAFEDVARKIETRYTVDGAQVLEDVNREMEAAIIKLATADPSTATAATVLEPDPVLTSHAAHVIPPKFNKHKGWPVTRATWSSSSAASEASFDEAVLLPHPLSVMPFTNRSSTPVTEWVIAQHPDQDQQSLDGNPCDSAEEQTSPTDESSTRPPVPPQVQESGDRFLIHYGDTSNSEQQAVMHQWLALGQEHLEGHDQHENSVSGEPIRHTFEVLHGPLREFVDFVSMGASNLQRFPTLSAMPLDLRNDQRTSNAAPDSFQSPTSLDFSLPSPPSDTPAAPV